MTLLDSWLDDQDIAVIPLRWGTRDFYYEALRLGEVEPKVIARALAYVEAANEVAKTTGLPFDVVVLAFNDGLNYSQVFEDVMTWRWRLKLYFDRNAFSLRWCVKRVVARACARCAGVIGSCLRRGSQAFRTRRAAFGRRVTRNRVRHDSSATLPDRGDDLLP